jgi:hypothetical protein
VAYTRRKEDKAPEDQDNDGYISAPFVMFYATAFVYSTIEVSISCNSFISAVYMMEHADLTCYHLYCKKI